MKTIEESIAAAMDAQQNTTIISFLPYILQDFWELGTPPEIVVNLIENHCKNYSNLNVIDLGCGKGAVSIKLAAALKCNCYGIDGIPEFIEASNEKAKEYGVETLCRFEVGDIREIIETSDKYDVIILGAIGQVFGDYYTTLITLSKNLREDGIIIINDAYIDDSSAYQQSGILPYREVLKQIGQAGMKLIDECTESSNAYAEEFENLKNRCQELIIKFPERTVLFNNFITAQAKEYDALETKIIGSIMVI